MFASLLRLRNRQRGREHSPFSSFYGTPEAARAQDQGHDDSDEEETDPVDIEDEYAGELVNRHEDIMEDGGEDGEDALLLPLFAAEHLDKLPIYNITHSIRLLVVQRCETTLSWDQVRSPQISAFLVKPIQEQIRSSHFSRATLYALLANMLQFLKEGQMNPGNVGVSKTRALICELLAMRLLKEHSTRELIDALSYDFHPLQGIATGMLTPGPGGQAARLSVGAVRISTLEIAIKSEAKRFLAHPLVVQQLEAIWAGMIVFHSAADNLHRRPESPPMRIRTAYGTIGTTAPSRPAKSSNAVAFEPGLRRSVTLYDPRDASFFKLSRLRVPRYRQTFSTLSFAVMLGLFLAVLVEKNLDITALEVLFWFWSAGYILDEIVGFTEQGLGLYIMSVWNALDIGILAFFVVYYVLRLLSIVMDEQKEHFAHMAYDVLAATSVLLFPRLFSVLDHIRYFSQILIAFRMMTRDLLAIVCLIAVACSGFVVIFSLSFGGNDSFTPASATYFLFEILMGYTPAAWEVWTTFNPLGKAMLTCYLVLSHFIIVTILVTVMTNSFMAIVQNAEHEHLYLFALNTISMVKSEALFSYIAPTNIIGWLISPLRHVLPFRRFIRINRTIIKVTHFPILLCIFAYERFSLAHFEYEPTELVERGRPAAKAPAFSLRAGGNLFSPGARLREHSVTTRQKDRALEEVFRRPFGDPGIRAAEQGTLAGRRKSSNVVHDWMRGMGNEGGASPPMEEPQSVLERLETRRGRGMQRALLSVGDRRVSGISRSVASDPEELLSHRRSIPRRVQGDGRLLSVGLHGNPQATDADGDDEATHDEDLITLDRSPDVGIERNRAKGKENSSMLPPGPDYFSTTPKQTGTPFISSSANTNRGHGQRPLPVQHAHGHPLLPNQPPPRRHNRQASTNTVIEAPMKGPALPPVRSTNQAVSRPHSPVRAPRPTTSTPSNTSPPSSSFERTPKRTPAFVLPIQNLEHVLHTSPPSKAPTRALTRTSAPTRQRMPPRDQSRSTPDIWHGVSKPIPTRPNANHPAASGPRDARRSAGGLTAAGGDSRWSRAPSFAALDLASDLGDNRHRPDFAALGGLPASFSTAQMAFAGFPGGGGGGGREPPQPRGRRGRDGGYGFDHRGAPGPDSDHSRHDNNTTTDDQDAGTASGEAVMVSRIMLARMNTMEEGFRELLSEVRDLRRGGGAAASSTGGGSGRATATGPGARSADEGEGAGAGPLGGVKGRRKRRGTARRVFKVEKAKEEGDGGGEADEELEKGMEMGGTSD